MTFRAFLFLLFLSVFGSALAQVPPPKSWSFHASYMANNAVYPGFNTGAEYLLGQKVKLRTKQRSKNGSVNQVKLHQVIVAGNLGMIWHPRTSTTLINSYTIEYRKTGPKRMQFQFGAGPAYMRSFLPKVYETDESGEVSRRYFAGRGYFAPQVFIGYGRIRKFGRSLQWWHIRILENTVLDYNNTAIPYLMLELRLGFHKKPLE